jgi:ABC-type multidrug transport system fused ATPase/permease subunit
VSPLDAAPRTPDIRGPWRYLWWLVVRHRRSFLLSCAANAVWVGSLAVNPGLIGAAVNAGLIGRNESALIWWGLIVLAMGVVQAASAMLGDRFILDAKVGSGYTTLRLVTAHVCDLGATVGRRMSAGDLVTVGVSDITLIGDAIETAARGAGGVAAFAVIAVLMLTASWRVGLLVLIGVPLTLLVTTRASRLLRRRQHEMRAHQRELTDDAVDIVWGLRVLRGFGGEGIFADRYADGSQRLRFAALRQARATALLRAAATFLPGLLLVGVVAMSANLVLARQLSVGQMVAFYGYATFLMGPVNRMTYTISKAAQAHVAAGHVTRLLSTPPDIAPGPGAPPGLDPALTPAPASAPMPEPGCAGVLADLVSGLEVAAGRLTAVVCTAADAVALADRLGRYTDSAATYDGLPLTDLPLKSVRERILVAAGDARLFAGVLRSELDPAGTADGTDDLLWEAVDAAAARDIIEALPAQFDSVAAAGGQGFSGGQQQRLRLARALMADTDVLILIDPASAVDAHTEAAMAAGIARLRRGRTTLVFTTSILLLGQADRVVLVIDGKVAAQGSHESLLDNERYRTLVERGMAVL